MTVNATAGGALLSCRSVAVAAAAVATAEEEAAAPPREVRIAAAPLHITRALPISLSAGKASAAAAGQLEEALRGPVALGVPVAPGAEEAKWVSSFSSTPTPFVQRGGLVSSTGAFLQATLPLSPRYA